ncbi:hypothetical protein RKD55_002122 [Rossellomorea marisflavi]
MTAFTNENKQLSHEEIETLLSTLKERFNTQMHRHEGIDWEKVEEALSEKPEKLWSLNQMEQTDGEPDVIGREEGRYVFCDCSKESPKGRRSACYDLKGLESRKKHKPEHNAMDLAAFMGIDILTEDQYRSLQELDEFDLKTSSWIQTPQEIRELGGALFCDRRYGKVFVYHNGAESYYAARGFRGLLYV